MVGAQGYAAVRDEARQQNLPAGAAVVAQEAIDFTTPSNGHQATWCSGKVGLSGISYFAINNGSWPISSRRH
jgi:hypothetical protein